MASHTAPELSLPADAASVVWRIFGAGASPLNRRSSYDLIDPIIRKRVSPAEANRAIATIRGWFEVHADQRYIKTDMREPVSALVLDGIRTERSETAIWAAGSLDAERSACIIRSGWSPDETDSLVEAVLETLVRLCDSDKVLDAVWSFPEIDTTRAKIPKEDLVQKGRLEIFRHLDRHGFELVWMRLHATAGTLIDLVLALRPGRFQSLVKRLGHAVTGARAMQARVMRARVMQARAAEQMLSTALPSDHRTTLRWITNDSCDDLIALAILHTLETVNRLDDEPRSAERAVAEQHSWSTKLRPPRDDLDAAAASLLSGLVDRLAALDPLSCVRWIGELLSGAPYVLNAGHVDNNGKPRRIDQLERACTNLLARMAQQSWSDDLLTALRAGLRLTPRTTWTRHLIDVAWEIRDSAPARAVEIAQAMLYEYEQHVTRESERQKIVVNWSDWHDREWIDRTAAALVLSHKEVDVRNWVSSRCRTLPLSAWDAEEDHAAFITAERVSQICFLIGFQAFQVLRQLGRSIDPAAVRTLAEGLWNHCRFARRYLHEPPETSITAEFAAGIVVEFGEPSDTWLLDQARQPGVGPRALWAFSDQRRLKALRELGPDARHDETTTAELIRIASDRFDEETPFNLETLQFWGQLWLLLGAADQAGRTALAIIAFPRRTLDRTMEILVLKLIALASCAARPAPALKNYFGQRYHQLWPGGYTPSEERADREEVDGLLERSEFRVL